MQQIHYISIGLKEFTALYKETSITEQLADTDLNGPPLGLPERTATQLPTTAALLVTGLEGLFAVLEGGP